MYRSDDIENYYINGNNNDIYKFIKSSIYIYMDGIQDDHDYTVYLFSPV